MQYDTLLTLVLVVVFIEGERIMDSDLLTVHEVAVKLRVDDTTVRRWIKSGSLEAISLPHANKRQAYRIRKSTVDALLNSAA